MGGSEAVKSGAGSSAVRPNIAGLNGTCAARLLAVAAALALAACNGRQAEGGDCPAAARAHTVSGFCVPRYVSLKRGEVLGRKGPGKDYPAVWVYRVRGLPVQVVAETSDWRRVCDPQGGATWINRSMVDGRRTVMSIGADPISLQKTAKAGGPVTGLMVPRALANLGRCEGDWCRVTVEGVTGWAPAARLWGVAPAAQCH
jgi:SH3-like domain-containing protein